MGHDTFAFRDKAHAEKDTPRTDPELAYLRRSMSCFDRDLIYYVLGPRAERHYSGVSGDGATETFTKKELRNALAKLVSEHGADDQRAFLQKCIDATGDTVVIGFY